jgi:hypothetical protein
MILPPVGPAYTRLLLISNVLMQTSCQHINTYKNNWLHKFSLSQMGRRCRNQIDEPAETQETRVIWHWGVNASGEAAMQQ